MHENDNPANSGMAPTYGLSGGGCLSADRSLTVALNASAADNPAERALADWIVRSSGHGGPLDAASADKVAVGRIVGAADGPGGGDRTATLEHLAELARTTKLHCGDKVVANTITANRITVVSAKPDMFRVEPSPADAEARATALALTIAAQEDEITTLRGMLGLREAQVRDLRDAIAELNKQVAFLEAEERRERAAAAHLQAPRDQRPDDVADWTMPGRLPRGMR